MYKTKVKEQYQDGFYRDEDYIVLCDMNYGAKVLLLEPESMRLSDIYKNKITHNEVETPLDTVVIVKAKLERYERDFGLHGHYFLMGVKSDRVVIKSIENEKDIKSVFPSRLIVVDYEGMEDRE